MKLRPPLFSLLFQLQSLLFISGFTALLLEIVYVKLLRYWAGNTAYAVACVLCAYMAGLTVGSLAGGRWLLHAKNLLAVYGGLELLIGLYSAGLPWLMEHLKSAYLDLTYRLGPDTDLAHLAHFLAAASLLLLPTLLMGAGFPVMVRAGSSGFEDRPEVAEKLYAANLAGAALGALLSDFLFIPLWGLGNPLVLVAFINAGVAAWAVVLGRRRPAVTAQAEDIRKQERFNRQKGGSSVFLVALAGGFLVLFQEIVWTHMVGRFLDSTAYGFAVMLFAVIAGLSLGAALVARNLAKTPAKGLLARTCLAAGLLVMILIPFWDRARILAVRYPIRSVCAAIVVLGLAGLLLGRQLGAAVSVIAPLFAVTVAILLYRGLNPTGSPFWITHGIGFTVCLLFMLAPAVLMGMIFPLALEWFLGTASGGRSAVARIYAANTIGSVAGIVVATFLALPRMGVEWSGRSVGLALFALGLLLLRREAKPRWTLPLAIIPVLAWTWLMPAWDFSKTHKVLGEAGRLIYAQEDLNGGLTTVIRTSANSTRLYSNTLIQAGNDYLVPDQARFALVPLLHAREMDRAMVIGLGSGETAGVVALFPFREIDLVDFSPGVVEAGRRFFQDINLGVYNRPQVKVHIADGRHYLLTHSEKLSLLTIELTRLWVAGEGDLYTREFYELCAERLTDRGILQQWVPLFRLSFQDVLIILRTVRVVFPQIALYLGDESGMIVASSSPLVADFHRLREMDSNPQLSAILARIRLPSLFSVLGDCVLVPEGVDALLASVPEPRISTDLWPHLEHSAARHYLEGQTTAAARRFFLTAQEFRSLPIVGLDPAARPAVERWIREERDRQEATPASH